MTASLTFDPAENDRFWQKVRSLPGFPHGEDIPLRRMVFETDALFQLPAVLNELEISKDGRLLLVMDATPMRRGTAELKPLCLQILMDNGWTVEPLVLLPDAGGQVHTEMKRIQAVTQRIQPESAVISLGSGVVTDIAKHACYLVEQAGGGKIPFIVVQTANSVSAYTSNMAPVFVDGVKRTLPSRYPDALICDLQTLCDAPLEMTRAGVGDMLAAFVSLADWYLAVKLGIDPAYNPLPEALLDNLYPVLLAAAEDIRQPTPGGMSVLAKIIALGGLAMSLSHATTPLSGYEHVISHVLDLINERTGAPLAMHGSQVALATLLTSRAYQIFLEEFRPHQIDPQRCYPPAEQMEQLIQQTFQVLDPAGAVAAECWSDYRQKLSAWSENRPALLAFLQEWPVISSTLRRLRRPPEDVALILERVNAPTRFHQLQPLVEEARARYAFLNAPFIRKRLTLGDVLIFFHWDRHKLWQRLWQAVQ
ncbi:MAG: iron-containing alcohol dehydrogenase [Chloroflexota bacterium]